MVDDRAQQVGLFRYSLVRELASERLSNRERGALARELAAQEHIGPDGLWVRVSRTSLDRWTRAYRLGGFEALVPAPRRVETRTPAHLLKMACALRREQPARTAAQIHRILVEAEGWSPIGADVAASLGGGWPAVEGRFARAGDGPVRG